MAFSPAVAKPLEKLGIRSTFDLVLHLPMRYEDETRLTPIREAQPGESVLVEAEVVESEVKYRGRRTLVAKLTDGKSELWIRFLNFYPSQVKQLEPGKRVRVFGEIRPGFFGDEMVHPRVKVVGKDTPLPKSLTPVYPTTAGLSQHQLRELILGALDKLALEDTLDNALLAKLRLGEFRESVLFLHRPPPGVDRTSLDERTHPAWERLKFDEILAQQLAMRIAYRERRAKSAPKLPDKHTLTNALVKSLPFALTKAQKKSYATIARDLAEAHPMRRLLQGDVGSGKTLVAALAALQAIENGAQVALMAPTEILAEQHFLKLSHWLVPLGVRIAWVAGSLKARAKKQALAGIAAGETQLAIGTHALFQGDVAFARLGLAIVDEQQRFGVEQRLALAAKGGEPHQLMMSATPIPRTLSMSYFADLDVSVIDELPPGRTPVQTKLVSEKRRDEVIKRIRTACAEGAQAYWVCPLIEESETLQLKTALETFETIKETFPDLAVGLVHGRLKAEEKAQVMADFKAKKIQLLVATTVIEVGVDVPNATLMVIEHAERMGLAQLHQLRGRVGRGAKKSHAILLYHQPLSEMARARLKVIYENNDGFEIARADLQLRGPGEFLGARQSGAPLLRFADLERDAHLIESARNVADDLLAGKSRAAARHLDRWLGTRQFYLKA
ncbi:ATP-dependent DNA helicase RecG [Usitatibacter palustris]|uniref:ATP-dependent DNA helicase RecG n=1 Tax=Usitatibacter palustris TaxID=2732487 RepID=A0A6M4H3M7_9PROT|nr:ATP-dependent DNA helicase RecG [Usitatibacter palustris]QJR13313.1 ATP-dependent DNA helicase RecG [Usitatibacter palustris]